MLAAAPASLRILHLGLGAFHRAHQAAYLQRLIDSGDDRWSLASGNIRPGDDAGVAAMVRSAGRYTLETVTPAGERSYQRISSIGTVVPWKSGLAELVALGSDASTRIVSFTVTEAGYSLDADDKLDLGTAEIAADLQSARAGLAGSTVYGALCAILRERMRSDAGGVTLLCCDNLRHNGDRTRRALLQFIEAAGDMALLAWTRANTSSPNAMVDRITPRPTPQVVARVQAATGIDDPASLMAESFIQWVIEDDFVNGRPAWEAAGVQMVGLVAPYEEAKIRLLNASHSCIAWAGTLAGYSHINQGTRDDEIRGFAFDYVTDDAIPVLSPSPIDLPAYRDVVLGRFGNPVILDTNQRVAADSFAKIPAFVAPTIRDRLGRGESIDSTAMLPALFLACLRRWHAGTLPYPYQDQAMDPAIGHAICASADPVAALARDPALWGHLAGDDKLLAALGRAAARVESFEKARRAAT
ncbi:MAG: D-arabinitol 4-dehydrogenase [Ramlibacter sp.]|jgi:D-arabinitol 4-dehydrogenase|nr:D-arabinitol 4-dehydrogenase [Ramlibacter sp.]